MKRILDLFCGAGGMSYGIKQVFPKARFLGVDCSDPDISDVGGYALQTYELNIGETLDANIADLDPHTLDRPDILAGAPPCQPFSKANKNASHNTALVEKYLKIKDILRPRWWIMEEVPAVGKIAAEKGWFKPRYLEAREFNLPHKRKRLIAGNYPPVLKHPWEGITVRTPIASMRGYWHGKENREKIMYDFQRLYEHIMKNQFVNTPLAAEYAGETHRKTCGLTNCLVKGMGTVPTPTATDHKGLSQNYRRPGRISDIFGKRVEPELCAYVMGFPEDYEFVGPKRYKYKQIGNAVCPPVSRAIAEAIRDRPDEVFDTTMSRQGDLLNFL